MRISLALPILVFAATPALARQAAPAPAPQASPEARSIFATAIDPVRNRVVMFGGQSGGRALGDTWEFDGTRWIRSDAAAPPARIGHAMVYDPVRRVIVMWGGATAEVEPMDDTWVWDGRGWTQRPGAAPPPRFGHQLFWNAAQQRVIMIGGRSRDGDLHDAWAWDGQAWTALPGASFANAGPSPNVRVYLATLRADLRNLVTAQESFFADNVTYTSELSRLEIQASSGVTLRILSATNRGWAATAIHARAPNVECGIFVGNAPPPIPEARSEGEPACR